MKTTQQIEERVRELWVLRRSFDSKESTQAYQEQLTLCWVLGVDPLDIEEVSP